MEYIEEADYDSLIIPYQDAMANLMTRLDSLNNDYRQELSDPSYAGTNQKEGKYRRKAAQKGLQGERRGSKGKSDGYCRDPDHLLF